MSLDEKLHPHVFKKGPRILVKAYLSTSMVYQQEDVCQRTGCKCRKISEYKKGKKNPHSVRYVIGNKGTSFFGVPLCLGEE